MPEITNCATRDLGVSASPPTKMKECAVTDFRQATIYKPTGAYMKLAGLAASVVICASGLVLGAGASAQQTRAEQRVENEPVRHVLTTRVVSIRAGDGTILQGTLSL